jgi:hypothetical protein
MPVIQGSSLDEAVMTRIHVNASEFPLDIALLTVVTLILIFSKAEWAAISISPEAQLWSLIFGVVVWMIVAIVSWVRRIKLGRA